MLDRDTRPRIKDLLEQITSAQSDSAQTECENLVKKDDPKLPLRVTIKPGKASETAATSTITVQAPKGPVTLRKEDGSFKIDKAAVSQPTEPKAKPIPKPKPKKKKRSQGQLSRARRAVASAPPPGAWSAARR